jgi:carbamoyl-phosphate synthase large subunit
VIVQYGGQTPLKLALDLEANGVPIVGTSPDMIDAAEDRERFQKMLQELGLRQPPNRTARTEAEALALAQEIGYPLVVRPSYVWVVVRWKSCMNNVILSVTCVKP